jgi:hypothetical protein
MLLKNNCSYETNVWWIHWCLQGLGYQKCLWQPAWSLPSTPRNMAHRLHMCASHFSFRNSAPKSYMCAKIPHCTRMSRKLLTHTYSSPCGSSTSLWNEQSVLEGARVYVCLARASRGWGINSTGALSLRFFVHTSICSSKCSRMTLNVRLPAFYSLFTKTNEPNLTWCCVALSRRVESVISKTCENTSMTKKREVSCDIKKKEVLGLWCSKSGTRVYISVLLFSVREYKLFALFDSKSLWSAYDSLVSKNIWHQNTRLLCRPSASFKVCLLQTYRVLPAQHKEPMLQNLQFRKTKKKSEKH